MSHDDCEQNHKRTEIHLKVNGKYVRPRVSKPSGQVELRLEENQDTPDCVQRYTCNSQDGKKYVAFCFTRDSKCYSLTLEGGDLKLVPDQSVERPSVLGWFEMEDIKAGKTHYVKTTAGKIAVKDEKLLCIGDRNHATFTQVSCS